MSKLTKLRRQSANSLVRVGAGLIVLAAVGAPSVAQAPALAMLDRLDKGLWEVRFRDDSASKKVCLKSGRELIQLRHSDTNCSRYVVEDSPNDVTVQYTCRGNGYGRTSIRRETSSLVQIQGQGIQASLPFEFTAEARRVGACR